VRGGLVGFPVFVNRKMRAMVRAFLFRAQGGFSFCAARRVSVFPFKVSFLFLSVGLFLAFQVLNFDVSSIILLKGLCNEAVVSLPTVVAISGTALGFGEAGWLLRFALPVALGGTEVAA
jgi:hypothetical protein